MPDSLAPHPTIHDVARAANVSIATVSRVINGRRDVSPGTRQRVEEVVAALGFSPRATARGLAGRRSHTVSMLFPSSYVASSNHDLDFVVGAADATSGLDYFFNLRTDPVDSEGLLGMFRSGLVEGVILMQITLDDWRVDLLASHDLPGVLIGRTGRAGDVPWVDFDFEEAVVALVDHAVATGHERVGFVGRSARMREDGVGSAVRLEEGWERAARKHGLADARVDSELEPLAAGQAALHLMDHNPGLTSIVVTHGESAVGVLRALAGRGVRVPQDVSVSTIATRRFADAVVPGLTVVEFPSATLGRQAASALVRLLDDRAAGRRSRVEQVLVPARLTVGGSTAPPRRHDPRPGRRTR
jgi:DNA-binding LacI/PurR family transcriptional regulator